MLTANMAAYVLAASLLTISPGLDTAFVVITATIEGPRQGMAAGLGIAAGCLAWGLLVALGLGAVLAASERAYALLRWIGAGYLVYLGAQLILKPRRHVAIASETVRAKGVARAFARDFLTNILNPKVGVFYVSFLPQFIPAGVRVPAMTLELTGVHAALGVAWFALLIAATRPIVQLISRRSIVASLDRLTGGLFILFGVRLATAAHR